MKRELGDICGIGLLCRALNLNPNDVPMENVKN